MKGKKSFYLSKRKKYYIYGYTKRAVLVAELLQREKYNFCGYIDKDAERLKKEYQIEVRTIDNNEIDKKSIIYISCYSIDTQHKIAEMLSRRGYNNLIFMAAGNSFSDKYATIVRKAWEMYDFEQIPHMIKLPKYRTDYIESDVIKKRGKDIIAWIPVELLYSIPKEKDKGDPQIWKIAPNDVDIPLVAINREVQFFECIMNHSNTCNEYVDSYLKLYNIDVKSKLIERRKILQIWDQELARGMDYFYDAAVKGIWNNAGYFNVLDGTHRCFYLLYRGFNMIPMIISENDYKKYYNENALKNLEINWSEMSLPHPKMYHNMLDNKERSFLWVSITQFFWERKERYHSFLDLEDRDGYWALAFKYYGIQKITCYKSKKENDLKKAMSLFRAENIEIISSLTIKIIDDDYDIIWCTDQTIPVKDFDKFVKKGKILIYDCDEKNASVSTKIRNNSPFFCYISVCGVMRTIYVFDEDGVNE